MADDLEERLAKRARAAHGGGWEGSHLELERQNPVKSEAIVDLAQFRNYQIGVGYQAKHVVRQPAISLSKPPPKPETDHSPTNFTSSRSGGGGGKRVVRNDPSPNHNNDDQQQQSLTMKYLNHAGLRRLRKELEIYK
jgi:hypothetical protein